MHPHVLIVLAAIGLAGCAGPTPSTPTPSTPSRSVAAATRPDAQALLGTWTVDLRPRPDAPPYLKTLVVTAVSGNTFQGSFYDTPLTEGRINADWGTLRIAFVTSDGSGPYNHSAVLAGGKLEGLTNSLGRGFLAYWSASRSP